ncbi:dihydroxy-acid dehydratase [Prescottella defluvii]|nr:dihydroxy-acid dehydratase [Prescottella defluvii]
MRRYPRSDLEAASLARDSGVRIVEMVREDLRMSAVVTRRSLENAIRANTAIGGSTNAVVHLLALAGRLEGSSRTVRLRRAFGGYPAPGQFDAVRDYLMEDFYYAGGLPAVIAELGDLLHTGARTVTGRTLGENVESAPIWDDDVIRTRRAPLRKEAGIAVLTGNLAPNGAVIKTSAASPHLVRHAGRAVVFHGMDDFRARIDCPDLDIEPDEHHRAHRGRPRRGAGMPEVGTCPLPKRLLERGVTDMVRISDARMSGTAFGTVVLHVAPEAAVGGPLALVRHGDLIELDVPAGHLRLLVDEKELHARAEEREPAPATETSGYRRLFVDHVLQADRGVDFDFLVGKRGTAVHGDNH